MSNKIEMCLCGTEVRMKDNVCPVCGRQFDEDHQEKLRCDECREHTDEMLTEHYCAGAAHFGYNKDIGLFCPHCIKEILLNDAIELRKAQEKLRVHDGRKIK